MIEKESQVNILIEKEPKFENLIEKTKERQYFDRNNIESKDFDRTEESRFFESHLDSNYTKANIWIVKSIDTLLR